MTENYIHILVGSILLDLGVGSPQNVLASVSAFRNHVKPLDWSWRQQMPFKPETNTFLEGNIGNYGIPFVVDHPAAFNAYYLCYYISWKSGISLVVDIIVATASLFMAFWGLLNVVLRFWATKASDKRESFRYFILTQAK
ncbi:hypothetical protein RhiJN_01544 [Ceratobasidium sp. AG-Ba]|nr:hypothetical protein RhiJN_01544 [Ceratobasidium sp. AG-Ba]